MVGEALADLSASDWTAAMNLEAAVAAGHDPTPSLASLTSSSAHQSSFDESDSVNFQVSALFFLGLFSPAPSHQRILGTERWMERDLGGG